MKITFLHLGDEANPDWIVHFLISCRLPGIGKLRFIDKGVMSSTGSCDGMVTYGSSPLQRPYGPKCTQGSLHVSKVVNLSTCCYAASCDIAHVVSLMFMLVMLRPVMSHGSFS